MLETEGELIIKPYGRFVFRSAEEVAESGVIIFPESLNAIWPNLCPSAADRYRKALNPKTAAPKPLAHELVRT